MSRCLFGKYYYHSGEPLSFSSLTSHFPIWRTDRPTDRTNNWSKFTTISSAAVSCSLARSEWNNTELWSAHLAGSVQLDSRCASRKVVATGGGRLPTDGSREQIRIALMLVVRESWPSIRPRGCSFVCPG